MSNSASVFIETLYPSLDLLSQLDELFEWFVGRGKDDMIDCWQDFTLLSDAEKSALIEEWELVRDRI